MAVFPPFSCVDSYGLHDVPLPPIMAQALETTAPHAAAFYDLDGTLCSANVVHAYGYVARNQPSLLSSLRKTASTVASIPMFLMADFHSRKLFNQLFYRRYKGESEDRLRLMAHDLFNSVVKPNIFPQAYSLIEQSRRAGMQQVLVTGALDLIAEPVAEHFGMDAYVANRLEVVRGYATGRILEPLLAGAAKATWIRQYVKDHGFDLETCHAYSDSMSDYPMLTVVGRPSVINPDKRLKRVAQSFDWPVLSFASRKR